MTRFPDMARFPNINISEYERSLKRVREEIESDERKKKQIQRKKALGMETLLEELELINIRDSILSQDSIQMLNR